MRQILVRAIEYVLEDWAALDEAHKGISYDEAVHSIESWKKDLEEKNGC